MHHKSDHRGHYVHRRIVGLLIVAAGCAFTFCLSACSTAPKKEVDRDAFRARADSTTVWFERSVAGLRKQINGSAGYITFPDVAQWGILISGGTWGRGALYSPDGRQLGWAALNTGSIGLQVGVQGFRMLLVLENQQVLADFKANKLTGSAAGVAVAGEAAATGKVPFTNGVALYEGANKGLMVGVNVGLEYIRYQPLSAGR